MNIGLLKYQKFRFRVNITDVLITLILPLRLA